MGKAVNSLQSRVAVNLEEQWASAELHPITGWTEFSEDPELQDGYYLAVAVTAENADEITGRCVGNASEVNAVTLDDGALLFYVTNDAVTLEVTAHGGGKTDTVELTADINYLSA